ncbi:MAG: neutral/alkaline non-lysosomal ceramidase N-terminal domain-containing protein [Opitutaceae bacterium]
MPSPSPIHVPAPKREAGSHPSSPPGAKPAFLAGFGVSDITPRVGVDLAGFGPYLNRQSTSVLAPLKARAAAFKSGNDRALILSLDLCGLTGRLIQQIRKSIQERTGWPPESIMVVCTHTHSGPSTVGHIGWGRPDDLYLETLSMRSAAAAEQAIASLIEVTVSFAEPACEGIAINRDYDAAYERHLPVDHFLDPGWRPAKPERTDTTCAVISFRHKGGLVGFISSFGCHPVVCCERNTQIHGDFVSLGTMSAESSFPGSVGLFLPGALGDVNPSISHRPADESLRALQVISERFADSIRHGIENGHPIPDTSLATTSRFPRFPRVAWSETDVDDRIRELENRLHQPGLTDDPLAGDDVLRRTGMDMVRLAGLRIVRDRMARGEELNPPSEIQGIRIGPIRILGAPFEVFQETKNTVLANLGESPTLVLSLVNGAEGYAPDPTVFERQGYSAEFVPLMKGDLPHRCLHDLLVSELTQLATDLDRSGPTS